MIRHIVTFIAMFTVGAVVAFATRAALHEPHAGAATHASPPHASAASHSGTAHDAASAHREHASGAIAAAATKEAPAPAPSAGGPVNSVCAICGMDVDPKLPTLEYQGKKIGFGCRMCPPKFKADPDKYGPYYLRNEVIKR